MLDSIWLSDMDSNHDKGLQRALCYHYTIGQTCVTLASLALSGKAILGRSDASSLNRGSDALVATTNTPQAFQLFFPPLARNLRA
jgi:hypothetical protein